MDKSNLGEHGSRRRAPSRRYGLPQSADWVGTEVKSKERGKREGLFCGPTFNAHHSPSVDTFCQPLLLAQDWAYDPGQAHP